MMKKIFKKSIIILLVVYLFAGSFFQVEKTEAAKEGTLGYYEEKLAQAKSDAAANKSALNKTESEITAAQNRIQSLKNETLALTEEVKKLTEEIEKNQFEITDKLSESKQIIEYMQLSSGHNVYLDYVFKADSITDLINRGYVVKEIVAYNEKVIEEMKQIIKDNEKRQVEIDERKVKIAETEKQLESSIVSLGEKKESLTSGGVDIEKEIKIYQEQVNYYKKLGCKSNDVIGKDCAVSGSGGTGVFRRPTVTGYITQEQYYSASYTHRAVDIGSKNGRGEKIYPIADGRISAIYRDNYGALCVTIEHYNVLDKKYYTSLYAHMSSYAPGIYVGQNITSNQYIGYMGDTGKAYGVHLHMEVIPCRLYNAADKNCRTWSMYDSYAKQVLRNGFNLRNLISFPKGTYNSWSSR